MPHTIDRKIKRKAVYNVLQTIAFDGSSWHCCDATFDTRQNITRHIYIAHAKELQDWYTRLEEQDTESTLSTDTTDTTEAKLRARRAAKGESDPITLQCNCHPEASRVILFYKYTPIHDPSDYAQQQLSICEKLGLTGKVRVASEGINITVAGPKEAIEAYIDWISTTAPLLDNQLMPSDDPTLATRRYNFFKPSPGCVHVFANLSVKLVDEICPLGRPLPLAQLSAASHRQGKLSPAEFHAKLKQLDPTDDSTVVLDTRNYYESRIGMFQGAITPAIRKFSRFPDYVDRNKEALKGKTILTYCTGGIRCEKATAYMRQVLSDDTTIYMLDGGIHNYIEWWNNECKQSPSDEDTIQWLGKNYVFDARQGLTSEDASQVTGKCQSCQRPWDVYQKCAGNCHLLVLYCPACQDDDGVYCCLDCKQGIVGEDGVCACERQRRRAELEPIAIQVIKKSASSL